MVLLGSLRSLTAGRLRLQFELFGDLWYRVMLACILIANAT